MSRCFKGRDQILIVAFTLGVPIATVWFVYKPNETWAYFDVACFHRFVLYLCMATFLLPSLVTYALLFWVNLFLMRRGAGIELRTIEEKIVRSLSYAYVSTTVLEKGEADLVEEYAWARLKRYWSRS
jgi:hypothetical protein